MTIRKFSLELKARITVLHHSAGFGSASLDPGKVGGSVYHTHHE